MFNWLLTLLNEVRVGRGGRGGRGSPRRRATVIFIPDFYFVAELTHVAQAAEVLLRGWDGLCREQAMPMALRHRMSASQLLDPRLLSLHQFPNWLLNWLLCWILHWILH